MSRIDSTTAMSNPRAYIQWYLETKKITINGQGKLVDGSGRDTSSVFDSLWLDYLEALAAHNSVTVHAGGRSVKGFTEQTCLKALNEASVKAITERRKEIIASIKSTQENLEPLKLWLQALTGRSDAHELALLAHWIQSVKRKMLGLPISDHKMLVFYGIQKAGKSIAIDKLVEPINGYVMKSRLDKLSDPFSYRGFQNNYIFFADEMQGILKADLDALKHQITTGYNTARRPHTDIEERYDQNMTFIGATNKNLNEQLYDSTGMRRFYQINCADKANWETINKIDYLELWQGVLDDFDYLAPHLNIINEEQQELVLDDEFTLFLQAQNINTKEAVEFKDITPVEFYRSYTQWASDNGYRPVSSCKFSKAIGNRIGKSIVEREGSKTRRVYKINKDALIPVTYAYAHSTPSASSWS